MTARSSWIAGRGDSFAEYYATISGGTPAAMHYRPSTNHPAMREEAEDPDPIDPAAWQERFAEALYDGREVERRRGVTLAGPHRDDVSFRVRPHDGERDLRSFGSSGQQRTAALALRLSETDTLRDRLGREPLYLLDDVFAELDEERSRRLLRLLDRNRSGQVILTAPKTGDIELRGGNLEQWGIRDGRLVR